MFYIEDQDPILVKKEVLLDTDKLKKLFQEIQVRFGGYVHRSYDGAFGPYYFKQALGGDMKYIKNYSETSKASGGNGKGGDLDLTHYEYDEYVLPELAHLVRRLLEGDSTVIDAIKKGPVQAVKENGEAGQRELHKELQALLDSSPEDMDPDRFLQLTEKIKQYYREDAKDAEQEDLTELGIYYEKVWNCLEFRPVKTLYKDKWNELKRIYRDMKDFYEGTGLLEEGMKSL